MMPPVAVVIVNYRTPEMTLAGVAALAVERTAIPDLRVVVVDGGSGDGSAALLRDGLAAHDWVDLLALELNGGFGWANNQAMLHLLQGSNPPEFIHLLNPDAVITPCAVVALRDALVADPMCGAAGSQLLDADGSKGGSAFRFPTIFSEFFRGAQMNRLGHAMGLREGTLRSEAPILADWVTGASVMLRVEALWQVGLFDTGFFLYFEEVELMHRLRKSGWTIRFVPESHVVHIGGAATGMAGPELHERDAIPDYIFASRRRFFTRAYGPAAAWMANFAWLAGNALLRTLKTVGLMQQRPSADAERSGLWRHGSTPSALDRTAAVTRCNELRGNPPAWMGRS